MKKLFILLLLPLLTFGQTDSDFPPAAAFPKSFEFLQVTDGLNVPYMVSATDTVVWAQLSNDSLVRPFTLAQLKNYLNLYSKDQVDSIAELYTATNELGWASYQAANYTSEAPLSVSEGDTALLELTDLTVIDTYIPSDVEALYDVTNSIIVPVQLGASYTVRISWKEESSINAGRAEILLDIGPDDANVIPIVRQEFSLTKGIGIQQNFTTSILLYSLDTFMANGCKIKLVSLAGNTDIYDVTVLISVNYRP
jgi:hypothetical protein